MLLAVGYHIRKMMNNMKGIYLGACRAVHPNYHDIVYQLLSIF